MKAQQPAIWACLDGAALTGAVCDYAAWIARQVGAPVQLIHTIDHHPEKAAKQDMTGNIGLGSREHLLEKMTEEEQGYSKQRIKQGKALLDDGKNRVGEAGITEVYTALQHGGLIENLTAQDADIRALVIGARGKIHQDKPDQIGAKLTEMIRALHKPMLVTYGPFTEPKKLMIAYNGSESCEKAIEMVTQSRLYRGMTCHLVYVGDNANAKEKLQQAAERLKATEDMDLQIANLKGKAEEKLCAYQQEQAIDLTVMGAFSHTRLHDLLLGSFTHKMLLKTQKPLLLLR
ncbi:MAG: universal stress protein [Methylococcales bacterium]|nr:universal stress protein [Methylococcales bacterium]